MIKLNKILILIILVFSLFFHVWGKELNISSFNINYGNRKIKLTSEEILESGADVVLIQEASKNFEYGVKKYLSKTYPYVWFSGHSSREAGRFAVLSKTLVIDKKCHEKSAGLFGFQTFKIVFSGKTITFVHVHLNPPDLRSSHTVTALISAISKNEKIHIKELKNILKTYNKNEPTLVIGDFNCFPGIGAYNVLGARGFIDSHLSVDPKANAIPTWGMTIRNIAFRFRLDYIFHNKFLKTDSFKVTELPYSDHAILSCKISLKQRK